MKSFVTKIMSQKIRINFFATTSLMKLYKNHMPFKTLSSIFVSPSTDYSSKIKVLTDIIYQNY